MLTNVHINIERLKVYEIVHKTLNKILSSGGNRSNIFHNVLINKSKVFKRIFHWVEDGYANKKLVFSVGSHGKNHKLANIIFKWPQ